MEGSRRTMPASASSLPGSSLLCKTPPALSASPPSPRRPPLSLFRLSVRPHDGCRRAHVSLHRWRVADGRLREGQRGRRRAEEGRAGRTALAAVVVIELEEGGQLLQAALVQQVVPAWVGGWVGKGEGGLTGSQGARRAGGHRALA